MQILQLILGIPAIVLIFMPYVWGVSPWEAASSWNDSLTGLSIGLLGLPFFLALPIFVTDLQRFLKRNLPRSETVILHSIAYAALACSPAALVLGGLENGFTGEIILAFLVFTILMLIPVSLILRARRLRSEKATFVILRVAWLPNAVMCAISFWSDAWQVGAYLAAWTIFVYGIEIAILLTWKRTNSERNAPLTGHLS